MMIEIREEIELIKHSINSMNARMDAFVDQIYTTKQTLYAQAETSINRLKEQGDNNYLRISEMLNDIKEFDSLKKDLKENTGIIKKLKKELNDNFNLKDELKKTSSRLDEIEDYFEKYNLETILNEISKLEKEYQNKISSILSNISIKKDKKKCPNA